jgi:hypothetical protein
MGSDMHLYSQHSGSWSKQEVHLSQEFETSMGNTVKPYVGTKAHSINHLISDKFYLHSLPYNLVFYQ